MLERRDDKGQKATLLDENPQAFPPVFILAPVHRSGTNYLTYILLLHPNFQLPNLIWEDHVLMRSQLLAKYASQTSMSKGWAKEIRGDEDYSKSLLKHLGGGILSFLYEHIGKERRLLCKTPRGYHVGNFLRLFPNAKLLVLIRDGRDVVSSMVKIGRHRFVAFEWYA